MKHLAIPALMAALLMLTAMTPAAAAPNIYGTSGLIEIPDDVICPVGSVSVAYHTIMNIGGSDEDINFFTLETGVLPKLSISGGVASDGGTNAIINAKYRLSPETSARPSITLGVIDAAAQLDSDSSNPGIYLLFAKNLTATAEQIVGSESKPLRGYLGLGTGVLDGIFLGLNWTLTPKLQATIEFVSGDSAVAAGSHFNGGVRLALTNEIRLDAGFVDFKDLTAGISYNMMRF